MCLILLVFDPYQLGILPLLVANAFTSYGASLNYCLPWQHHPGLGIGVRKVFKLNNPASWLKYHAYDPSTGAEAIVVDSAGTALSSQSIYDQKVSLAASFSFSQALTRQGRILRHANDN